MTTKNKLKAIDFFSGAGGLTHGLKVAGIDVIAGIDNDGTCKDTFEKNNAGAIFLEKDITKYLPADLERDLKIQKNDDYMIFAGCAPCQFWSIIRTSKEKSKKTRNLILDFQEFIEYFKPGFVVVENVPGISSKKGSPMGRFIAALESLGYNVAHDITDMSLYGIPQKRRRFTLLASRISPISLPKPTGKRMTVRDVLGIKNGFIKIKAGMADKTDFLHTVAGLSKKNIERLRMTNKNGGDRSAWQNNAKYQLTCYASGEKKFYDTYGRMWWDKPSPTITTKFFSVSNGRFAHPEEDRAISLREGATLQTFPKNYRFVGTSVASIAKMIGNAVPPEFAEIIGRQIIKAANEI
ncbi:MAG: Modification methylase [Parcubacteria group bacterium GW2011_GWC2_40_31]|nr:MAG: Modification methylase [Parcubacteria group bacterium GW2011_GWC2_40_31]